MKKLLSAYIIVGYLAFLQRGFLTLTQVIVGIAITLIVLHLAIALISVVKKN